MITLYVFCLENAIILLLNFWQDFSFAFLITLNSFHLNETEKLTLNDSKTSILVANNRKKYLPNNLIITYNSNMYYTYYFNL